MHRSRAVFCSIFVALLSIPALAQGNSRLYRGSVVHPLTGPSNASPAAIVGQFLRTQGFDGPTVASIVSVAQQNSPRSGIVQARMEQRLGGLRIYDTELKAALTGRGALIHLIENVVPVSTPVRTARADERQALRAALLTLYPTLNIPLTVAGRDGGDTVLFVRDPFFHSEPRVTRVITPDATGALRQAFLVETWSESGNLLHETLVSGEGVVLSAELRTNTDSYNVFTIDPSKTPQSVVSGPGAGNAQSPAGWLFAGAQNTISIAGNNAHAYLDADNNGAPDAGGTSVTDGNFLTAWDGTVTPATDANRNVAIQNLFFLNNAFHDELYRHGFDEAAGNFQENNFGLGGRGSDSVNAEGQDGGGTDNANFATPRDGRNPRMQMYLWTGKPSHEVVIGGASYGAGGAAFGPALNATGITAIVAIANDGTAPTSDACEALPAGSLSGQIGLVDRGTCTFVTKVKNAQNAGAVGVIVANNQGDSILDMGGTDATITIPSVFVGQTDGNAIRASAGASGTIRLKDPPALQRDGDLDSDIVYHEYCHGLTWRMIGRMDGALSGAIGEGMSDGCSVLMNQDDVVGEYSFSDPRGIRTAPYHNFPRTYSSVTGTEVHFDGEVYGAIVWRMFENFQAAGVSKDVLFDYVVDGMNFTPAHPSFEDMRDGILQSVANSGSGHDCLVWRAFASYGVGVGAKATVRGSNVIVTESFTLPPQCP